ncbi:unnamed protein product [Brassicogethes aeneus]|uniref:Uncharacterized protein n=1 Tax=Brassicogethes aeneus TaxID=1431903 RepID=A0A9P0B9I9_BRAAE|nr:unnamed protein product [Brassicogethes aeneus]
MEASTTSVGRFEKLRVILLRLKFLLVVPGKFHLVVEGKIKIAPAAKKLWGLEAKDAKSLACRLNHEGVWRDPTWAAPETVHRLRDNVVIRKTFKRVTNTCSETQATPRQKQIEHAVSAPLAMSRRGGGFAGGGGDTGSILSPRGSDNGGLGVKMVEYVLSTSPSNKDNMGLEPRLRALHLDEKDKDKPQSPKEEMNGQPVQNGQIDLTERDDQNPHIHTERTKSFNLHLPTDCLINHEAYRLAMLPNVNRFFFSYKKYSVHSRTPGSRQPSPAEEELNKNGMTLVPGTTLVLKPQEELQQHLHHLPPHLAPHLGVTLAESQQQQQQQQHQYPPPPPQPHQVDSAVLQQQQHNFDVQSRRFMHTHTQDNCIWNPLNPANKIVQGLFR